MALEHAWEIPKILNYNKKTAIQQMYPLSYLRVDYFIQGIDRCISGHNLIDLSVLNNP